MIQEMREIVSHMIDWLEVHLEETSILEQLSRYIGYSPW